MNSVFISYRHESPEHARAVQRLGDVLRQAKLPVELDQFYLGEHPGGPDEGWPKWCEDRANEAACVVIVPSPGWFAAYEKSAPGIGLGAASEADLFRQEFYDEQGHNERIRLAYLTEIAPATVPVRLRAWHNFRPFDSNEELDRLVAWIASRLGLGGIESPTVPWPDPKPEFRPDIADRHENEWPAIREMLAGKSPQRLLLFEAESGYGKSELLRQAAAYATQLGVPVCQLDFRANYGSVTEILGRISLDLGEHLPNFSREGGDKVYLLIKDLRALRRPVLFILDTYQKAAPVYQEWACSNLLAEVERALSVAVIVAGQPQLPPVEDARWQSVARALPLGPIRRLQDWESWVKRRYPNVKLDISTVLNLSRGVPKTFSDYYRLMAEQGPIATSDS